MSNLSLIQQQIRPLADIVCAAQEALTEHMQPHGPSKADTIKRLEGILLGARQNNALLAALNLEVLAADRAEALAACLSNAKEK